MKKNVFLVLAIVAIVAIIAIFAPKNQGSFSFKAGGGTSLKDLNKKDTVTTSASLTLQANQTTEQNLEQALFIGRYYKRQNGFFYGAGTVGGVSTEYGVVTPVLYCNAGLDFTKFQIEYMVGKFKRTGITTSFVDPQYSNFCTNLGEGASVANAMQLSFITGKSTKIGFGHQGADSFYDFSGGNWYAYMETPICKYISLAGGVNFQEDATGYVAVKASVKDNSFVLTGNKLGAEDQNIIVTYSRNNVSLFGAKMLMSVSAWAQETAQGFHFVTGLVKNRGTFYAELGSRTGSIYENAFNPYIGLGTSFSF